MHNPRQRWSLAFLNCVSKTRPLSENAVGLPVLVLKPETCASQTGAWCLRERRERCTCRRSNRFRNVHLEFRDLEHSSFKIPK